MRGLPAAMALLATFRGTAAAVDRWETTRATVIDPLNSAIHRRLPSLTKAHDLEGVLGLYTTPVGDGLRWEDPQVVYPGRGETMLRWTVTRGDEPIRDRYRHLFEIFPHIDRAELRLERVDWRHAADAGIPASARLIVRGIDADGVPAQLDQRTRILVRSTDDGWRIAAETVVARELVTRETPAFADATAAAGIANTHTNTGSPPFRLFGGGTDNPVGHSSGSAVGDVDGDGCDDVFMGGRPDAVLYRGHCDGTFTDATAAVGLPHPWPTAATGAVFFDYDNDGWPDLYVAAVSGGDRLFHNDGGGFRDVTAAARIPAGRWGSMPLAADYDRDGYLDLYVVRMGDYEATTPRPNYDAANGVPNTLLHNERDGTFRDVTDHAGVGHRGWDLAGAWGDYDGDGWPDLYVANEFGSNALYHNRGDGTFVDVARATGTVDGGSSMGVVWVDIDGDGDLDLYVSNMHANSGWALFHPDFPAPIPGPYRLLGFFTDRVRQRSDEIIDHLVRGSSLYRNDGNGHFTDVSEAAGVRDAQWAWAAEAIDYDDDGWPDLFVTNGFISGPLLDDV